MSRFSVDYGGQKSFYDGAKDSYVAGNEVVFYFNFIATDTSYRFMLDGKELNTGWDDGKGIKISFIMPDHDVKFRCESRNLMVDENYH